MSERVRERRGQADDHQREEDPDREHLGGVLERLVHAAAGAAVLRGEAVHDAGPVRGGEGAHREAHQQQDRGEERVREVDRQHREQHEAERRGEHAAGRERARAVAVGEDPETGPASRKPTVSGSIRIPAQSGVEAKS